MQALIDTIRACSNALATHVPAMRNEDTTTSASDEEIFEMLARSAELMRRAQATLITAIGEVQARSTATIKSERLTTQAGCGSVRELVQRSTLMSHREIRSLEALASMLRRERSMTTGELLPGDFSHLKAALLDGAIGADALDRATGPVRESRHRLPQQALHAIDATLAAAARGVPAESLLAPTGDESIDAALETCAAVTVAAAAESTCGLPASADELHGQAQLLVMVLDEDGAEPRERTALRKRGLTIGPERGGLVSVRGNLLPEVGAQLRLILDSLTNPKLQGPRFVPTASSSDFGMHTSDAGSDTATGSAADTVAGTAAGTAANIATISAIRTDSESNSGADQPDATPGDPMAEALEELHIYEERTRPQQLHDALATALSATARLGDLPQIGGAAPTLVVSVNARDLDAERGWAHVQGADEPVSLSLARHVACDGRVQRVVRGENGRIVSIGVHDRVFTAHQRRAILLRDGGCVIPGCSIPASWCEIHHVEEHSRGGPTHTDNGAAVCWHHHRMLDTNGWDIRMRNGVPEVQAPSRWDPYLRWRPATKSRIRFNELPSWAAG